MMNVFNAIQISALMGAGPLLLGWLHGASFKYAGPAFWLAIIVYIVMFIFNTVCVFTGIEKTH